MTAVPGLLTLVETTVFTKRITALGLEESLSLLQHELMLKPEAGDVSRGRAVCVRFGWVILAAARASVGAHASTTFG